MRNDVAWLYKAAAARGLIVGSAGNVSARTAGGMLILAKSMAFGSTRCAGRKAGISQEGAMGVNLR